MEAYLDNLLNITSKFSLLPGFQAPSAASNDLTVLNNLVSQYQKVCQLGSLIKQQIVQHSCYPQYIQNTLQVPDLAYNSQGEDSFKYEEQQAPTPNFYYCKIEEVQTQNSSVTFGKKDSLSTTPHNDSSNISSVKSENDESVGSEKVKEEIIFQEDNEDREDSPKIRRRNGFKGEDNKKEKKKSKKINEENRCIKHLWVSYGRPIALYAAKHTESKIKSRIQESQQKLKSKKAFFEVFKINKSDSQEDRDFKLTFGRLALEFLQDHAEEAFPSSNFREDLLAQKEKVSKWILSHISLE